MIGTFLDLTSAEAIVSSIHRSPVLKTLHHQQGTLSNYLTYKKDILILWCSKKAPGFHNRQPNSKGVILLLRISTLKLIKKIEVGRKINQIIPSVVEDQFIIVTDEGFIKCFCSKGFTLSPFKKLHNLHSILPIQQNEFLVLMRNEPTLTISKLNYKTNYESVLLDYGISGVILPDVLLLDEYGLIVYVAELEEPKLSAKLKFHNNQDELLFTAYNYKTKRLVHKVNQKFPGIVMLRLNRYYPEKKAILMEYNKNSEGGHFLSLWNLEKNHFVEIKKLKIDYFAGFGPNIMYLTATKNYEIVFLLIEITKQKQVKEDVECECSSVSIVALNTGNFEVEACGIIPKTEVKHRLEHINLYNEETNLFLAANKGCLSIIDNRALQKRKFDKPLTMYEFEHWLKNSDVPAKVKKIFLINDCDY